MIDFVLTFLVQVTNMGIVVEVLGELENFHMSREELEVRYYITWKYFYFKKLFAGYETGEAYQWVEAESERQQGARHQSQELDQKMEGLTRTRVRSPSRWGQQQQQQLQPGYQRKLSSQQQSHLPRPWVAGPFSSSRARQQLSGEPQGTAIQL